MLAVLSGPLGEVGLSWDKSAPLRSLLSAQTRSLGFHEENLQASGQVVLVHLQNWHFITIQYLGALFYFSSVFHFLMLEDNYITYKIGI